MFYKGRYLALQKMIEIKNNAVWNFEKSLNIEVGKNKVLEKNYDSVVRENSKLTNNLIKYLEVFGNRSNEQVPFFLDEYDYNYEQRPNTKQRSSTFRIPEIIIRRIEVK